MFFFLLVTSLNQLSRQALLKVFPNFRTSSSFVFPFALASPFG